MVPCVLHSPLPPLAPLHTASRSRRSIPSHLRPLLPLPPLPTLTAATTPLCPSPPVPPLPAPAAATTPTLPHVGSTTPAPPHAGSTASAPPHAAAPSPPHHCTHHGPLQGFLLSGFFIRSYPKLPLFPGCRRRRRLRPLHVAAGPLPFRSLPLHGAPRPQLPGQRLPQPRLLQEYLQADDVGGDHGLPPHAPRGRVVGRGGGRGGRRLRSSGSGGGRVGGHGGAMATSGGRGGSRGGSMVHHGGSSVGGHTFESPQELGAFEEEDEDGSEARSQTEEDDGSDDDQREEDDGDDDDQRVQEYILECQKKRRKIMTMAAAMIVHDMRMFKDAIDKYGDKIPHPPEGKFYFVDLGYPNRQGYLAAYKGTKYHLPEYQQGPMPRGKKEQFNYAHSSLCNVIERYFGVLKMKWRTLLDLPSYPMPKQSQNNYCVHGSTQFHSREFFRDADFDLVDHDENYVPFCEGSSSQGNVSNIHHGDEDQTMNQFRDWIADGLFSRS
ncbi:uncharacterized protein LOC101756042 isoform X3 [Setaria italica]|uniref:uncharacterized protein LOC101756042 isoform X3 n=1 Tax=Setaria italica TaxID=4555 RepID=UPI000BE5AF68|nr:uncharacterized protein LOC101756042 isoform X3 [Setaria italica]